mgnify:CR=1 FL=1
MFELLTCAYYKYAENFKDSIFLFYCFKSNLAGSEGIFPQITFNIFACIYFWPAPLMLLPGEISLYNISLYQLVCISGGFCDQTKTKNQLVQYQLVCTSWVVCWFLPPTACLSSYSPFDVATLNNSIYLTILN